MNADCWRVENRRGGGGGPVGAACYMTALQTTSNQTRNQTPPFKTSLFWTFTNSSDIRKKKSNANRNEDVAVNAATALLGPKRSNKFREWGTGVEVDRQQENRPRTVCEMLDGMFVSSTRFQFLSVPVSKVWSTRKGWGVRQVEGIEKAAFKAFINHFTPVFIF